jgi:hypothetical protein
VAYATATYGDDTVTVTFDNLFPQVPVSADFLLHYAGSIPVKVDLLDVQVLGINGAQITIEYFESNEFGDYDEGRPIALAMMQLHYCDYIVVVITITLEQVQTNMNQQGTVVGTISVMQWNEVPDPS